MWRVAADEQLGSMRWRCSARLRVGTTIGGDCVVVVAGSVETSARGTLGKTSVVVMTFRLPSLVQIEIAVSTRLSLIGCETSSMRSSIPLATFLAALASGGLFFRTGGIA
jgi:hypothetical protein